MKSTDTRKNTRQDNKENNHVVILSGKCEVTARFYLDSMYLKSFSHLDDPVIKQQQIDEIDAPSFVMKSFKTSKTENQTSNALFSNAFSSNGETHSLTNHDDILNTNDGLRVPDVKDKKNDTVFHDNVSILAV